MNNHGACIVEREKSTFALRLRTTFWVRKNFNRYELSQLVEDLDHLLKKPKLNSLFRYHLIIILFLSGRLKKL